MTQKEIVAAFKRGELVVKETGEPVSPEPEKAAPAPEPEKTEEEKRLIRRAAIAEILHTLVNASPAFDNSRKAELFQLLAI